MNPIQMLQCMKNPSQFVKQLLGNNPNPLMNNLVNMANKGDKNGVEQFARNLFKENGRDFDKEFNQFRQQFR